MWNWIERVLFGPMCDNCNKNESRFRAYDPFDDIIEGLDIGGQEVSKCWWCCECYNDRAMEL